MRKKEKEIKNIQEIESIINKAAICRLAVCTDNQPYIIPMNFGYKNKTLYFHTGHKGKKIDILELNPKVSFEMECDTRLISADLACGWTMAYRSVIGYGTAEFITDKQEKINALDIIMAHYTSPPFQYKQSSLDKTCIIKVNISQMSGRSSKI